MTLPGDVPARLREALTEAADARPVGAPPAFSWETPTTAARTHRRPAVRVARVLAPVAVAAATAAALVLPGGDPGAGQGPTADASPGPVTAADPALVPAALLGPGTTVPMAPGQYRYDRISTTDPGGGTAVVETWEPQDPTQEWTERYVLHAADGTPAAPVVRTVRCGAFQPAGRPAPADPCADVPNALATSAEDLAGLPTDPAALYERMRHEELDVLLPSLGIDPEGDAAVESAYVFDHAWGLARGATGLSQPVSAALEQAIALIPGVIVRPDATTPAGLHGTSYRAPYTGAELGDMVFDANGNFIGGSDYTIEVGAADAPLEVPADLD